MSKTAQAYAKKIIAEKTVEAMKYAEKKIDAELERLDSLTTDDLETLRRKRIEELKQRSSKLQEWRQKGHGEYSEIADQKEFFQAVKDSERVVVHFYRTSTWRCGIVDRHLSALAKKHIETRFIKVDAEKSPFVSERLQIHVLPTILCTKDAKVEHRFEGFDEMGGRDDFTTAELERRLAGKSMIELDPSEMAPPPATTKRQAVKANPFGSAVYASSKGRKRDGEEEDEDDDDDGARSESDRD